MNYRHAFHAGNFADVVKHAVMTRVIVHLRAKPTAFRVVDTHAGAGRYDLAGPEAQRSGEWREGIARLRSAALPPSARVLLAPYLDIVAAANPHGATTSYPGSPLIAAALLRAQDRLVACELEPAAAAALGRALRADGRTKAVHLDGWTALKAYIPPPERRGLVVIDPPFEAADEFAILTRAVIAAHRKWPSGVYLVWYPIKRPADAAELTAAVAGAGIGKALNLTFGRPSGAEPQRLHDCGLVILNPPWRLADDLRVLLPALAYALGGPAGRAEFGWLTAEK